MKITKNRRVRRRYGGKMVRMLLVSALLTAMTEALAVTSYSISYIWSNTYDGSYGQLAGSCTYSYPDSQPFAVSRSVVADNSVPVGAILMSWSYADFNVPLSVSCTGSGTGGQYTNLYASVGAINVTSSSALAGAGYNIAGTMTGTGVLNTSVEGIGIRFYVQSDASDLGSGLHTPAYIRLAGFGGATSAPIFAASGVEYPYVGPNAGNVAPVVSMLETRTENGVTRWFMPTRSVSISLRADLIKTGYVATYGPVSVSHLFNSWMNSSPANSAVGAPPPASHFLTGSGVTLVRPTCKLSSQRSTDYSVNMGVWAADTMTHTGGPAYGPDIPVRLELECNGMAENVRMRFEDAGASHLTTNNISLYDATGGNKIDGLEIELMHNGTHIDINGPAVNLGSYGSGTWGGAGDHIYALPSTTWLPLVLQARYFQRASITCSGTLYTGPVSGTVNLFMVYD